MLSIAIRKAAMRTIGIVCLVTVQAATPSAVFAQAAQGRAALGGVATTATPSGFVSTASGTVFVRRGTGPEVPAKVGDIFGPGITFRTGGEGSAVLIFSDGQNVTLNTGSVLRIDDYRFDVSDLKSSKATLGLVSGVMRLVTGAIHTDNRDGLLISAGSASIGILSKDVTAFVVEVDPKSLGVGAAAVTVGEISIQTALGPIVTVSSEQFTRWQPGASPSVPVPLAAAPAIFQALVASSRANVLPSNGPLDIQSAAVQAVLEALSATGAGPTQPTVQAQAPEAVVAIIVPTVTPGGGRGCVGSPC
jgi:FecR protein